MVKDLPRSHWHEVAGWRFKLRSLYPKAYVLNHYAEKTSRCDQVMVQTAHSSLRTVHGRASKIRSWTQFEDKNLHFIRLSRGPSNRWPSPQGQQLSQRPLILWGGGASQKPSCASAVISFSLLQARVQGKPFSQLGPRRAPRTDQRLG